MRFKISTTMCRQCLSTAFSMTLVRMLGAGLIHGKGSGPKSSFMASAFREYGLRESCWANFSRERQARMRHSISCLWIVSGPVFYGISAVHGKSRLLRRLDSSKFPRDASSWAGRAQLRIRVQASRTSAYSGRASFGGEVRLLYNGFAVVTAAYPSLSSTTPDAHEYVEAR